MKGIKRSLIMLLAISLVITMFVGCVASQKDESPKGQSEATQSAQGNEKNYVNEEGFPIVNEPITLSVLVTNRGFSERYLVKEYERMTGIRMDFTEIEKSGMEEKINIILASNDLPDVFMKCRFGYNDLTRYATDGAFLNIKPYMDNYAPNLKDTLARYDDVKRSITLPDNGIYGYPDILDADTQNMGNKLFFNKKWLDAAGLDVPGTIDEFHNVLLAFKGLDMNGNGEQDELPFTALEWYTPFGLFRGAWGLGNRGRGNDHIDLDEETGKLRFYPADEREKEALQFYNKLYNDGLLDPDIFLKQNDTLVAKGDQGLVGSTVRGNHTIISTTNYNDYVPLKQALIGPHGDQLYSGVKPRLKLHGNYVVTTVCKYPEAAIRWVDYFYGDEGIKFYFLGIEGKTYYVDENGEYQYTDEVLNDKDSSYFMFGGTGTTSIKVDKYLIDEGSKGPTLEAAINFKPYAPKEIWAQFTYTAEELDELLGLTADIDNYVHEMEVQFIVGRKPFSEWNDYVNTLKKMDLDRFMEINQAAYERYQSIK